ncbi:MAG: transferase [Bacteroidetes bacterium]|nr:transferase [Bacteroidota bacterium]
MKKICIIGTGGFAKEVLLIIYDLRRMHEVACFMEPDDVWQERSIMDIPVRPQSEFDASFHTASIGIGNSMIREKVTQQLPAETKYETLISPKASWSPWNEAGEGSVVCAGAIATVGVKLGKHVHVNLLTTIGHDAVLEDFVTTTTSVSISGDCVLGRHSYWGNQSTIRQGLKVCEGAIIGMGGVVVKDITEPGTYVGIPAKKIK